LTTAAILAIPVILATLVTLAVVPLAADPVLLLLVLATTRLAANVKTVERGIMTATTVAAPEAPMFVTET